MVTIQDRVYQVQKDIITAIDLARLPLNEGPAQDALGQEIARAIMSVSDYDQTVAILSYALGEVVRHKLDNPDME